MVPRNRWSNGGEHSSSSSTMTWSGILASLLLLGAAAGSSRLDVIQLPLGFAPEGITLGREWTAFVGSRVREDPFLA